MEENHTNAVYAESDINELKELIKPYLTEKRYEHSISVMNEAERLGNIYMPEMVIKLKIAALLHDITKMADFEKQLQYSKEFDIILNNDQLKSPEILHALTACEVAKRDFSRYVDDDILSAIRNHTTGKAGMSVFDSIICLADYIEESRTHESCKSLRTSFYNLIDSGIDKYIVLYKTLITMFDNTISYLTNMSLDIDKNTASARDYFVGLADAALKREVNNEQ